MATYTTKNGHERLERFETSWETNASGELKFGDRRFGPDSALYAGFGYIRESEKKKGGRRKLAPNP